MEDTKKEFSFTTQFKESLRNYTRHARWFIITPFLGLVIAFLLVRYDVPQYLAQASIKVRNNESSEFDVFSDLNILSDEGSYAIEDEILGLSSQGNFMEVVKNLGLNLRLFSLGQVIDSEIYKNRPFTVNFIAPDSVINQANYTFFIRISSNETFGYATEYDGDYKVHKFGSNLDTPVGGMVITPNYNDYSDLYGARYRVELRSVFFTAYSYRNRMQILPVQPGSSVLDMFLADPVLQKGKDIINELVRVHNANTINSKKVTADRTSDFIDQRIISIYSDLSEVDSTAQEFKADRRVTDISSQSSLNMSEGAEVETQLQGVQIQLEMARSLKNIVESSEGNDILPTLEELGGGIAEATATYNSLVQQRRRILESSSENNPMVRSLDQSLQTLRQNIESSLNSATNNLNLQQNSLSQRMATINSRLYSAPRNERTLRDITRRQETKEALYLYLLQKREESQIAFASTEPNIIVIDPAYSLGGTVGLDPKLIYLAAIFLGLLIPFAIIYIKDLLDTKIHSKIDLERIVGDVPILGELPKLGKKDSKLVGLKDRSTFAEAIRILRTNLDYVLSDKLKKTSGKTVLITSSISGEGKTLIASNLALIIATSNKKVLLIGADIRNPSLGNFYGKLKKEADKEIVSQKQGLTEYLHNKSVSLNEIVHSLEIEGIAVDVIFSGKIPPNPAELILSERLGYLFDKVSEKYDYIIIDSAPMMLVADTISLAKYADQVLYVTKASYTEKRVIDYPLKVKKEGKITNLAFVVNNVKTADLGYGGSYGYGYNKKKKWWQFRKAS